MPKISVPVADNDFMCVPPGKQLPEVEEEYIRFTLRHANNNRARTAEILGISLRTLYKRLAEMAKTERRITAAAPAGIPK